MKNIDRRAFVGTAAMAAAGCAVFLKEDCLMVNKKKSMVKSWRWCSVLLAFAVDSAFSASLPKWPEPTMESKHRRSTGGWDRLWTSAISEAMWTGADKPGYEDFLKRMRVHRKRLVKRGVFCAPLPPYGMAVESVC